MKPGPIAALGFGSHVVIPAQAISLSGAGSPSTVGSDQTRHPPAMAPAPDPVTLEELSNLDAVPGDGASDKVAGP